MVFCAWVDPPSTANRSYPLDWHQSTASSATVMILSPLCCGDLDTLIAIIEVGGIEDPLPVRRPRRGGQLLRPGRRARRPHPADGRRHPRLRPLPPALRQDVAAP